MPLALYYLDLSPPVRSVDLVLQALGMTAVYKQLNLFEKDHFSEEFSKINPLHTVPAIVDEDGFVLWESRAIMTYLVSKYSKDDSLYPKDLKKRAIVDQRLHFSNDAFFAVRQITKSLLLQNNKTVSKDKIEQVKQVQENVEKLLEGSQFMAGDQLTLADYSFITIMDIAEVLSPTKNKFPLTKAWFERCKKTMKNFDKVNSKGASQLITLLEDHLE